MLPAFEVGDGFGVLSDDGSDCRVNRGRVTDLRQPQTRGKLFGIGVAEDGKLTEFSLQVDEHEIAEIIAGYALVAEHCREGGFDGIELQCSHSSIVRGFLSPATNVRTDKWGGGGGGSL